MNIWPEAKTYLLSVFSENWHRPHGLLTLLIVVLVTGLYFFSEIELSNIDPITILFIIFLLLSAFLVWIYFYRVPIIRVDQLGIVLAISSEQNNESKVIENDLISEIWAAFDNSQYTANFKVLKLPNWHAIQIKDNDSARRYLKRCRAHLLIFGTAKQRIINGKVLHVIKIRQIAAHKPIATTQSRAISEEVSSVLPTSITIDRENELLGFEITSFWITEAAKYFLAIAAMVSNELDLSESLLIDLRSSKFLASQHGISAIPKLRQLIIQRLSDVYFIKSGIAYKDWRITRQMDKLDEVKSYIEKYYSIDKNRSYNYHLANAVWHFCHDGDTETAISEIYKCRNCSDGTWRYSLAFLEAFKGNLDHAIKIYEKAFKRHIGHETIFEIEEFIIWILEKFPNLYQLYFCLGLINMKAKQDGLLAAKDFKEFIDRCKSNEFEYAYRLAEQYIEQLQSDLISTVSDQYK